MSVQSAARTGSLSTECGRGNSFPGGASPDVLRHMPKSCRDVFFYLASLAEPGTTIEVSLRELGSATGFSHEQVRRAIKRLSGARLISWRNRGRGRGRKSRFRVLWRFRRGAKVTPGARRVAESSEPGFSTEIAGVGGSGGAASPLSHTLSPLGTPEKETAQRADAPKGASALPRHAKFLRAVAFSLRWTPLFEEEVLGVDPFDFKEIRKLAELEDHASRAILTALWRMRGQWRGRAHVWTAVRLVVYRVRFSDVWCWSWWRARGVRAVYALITKWVAQALALTERLFCLTSKALSSTSPVNCGSARAEGSDRLGVAREALGPLGPGGQEVIDECDAQGTRTAGTSGGRE